MLNNVIYHVCVAYVVLRDMTLFMMIALIAMMMMIEVISSFYHADNVIHDQNMLITIHNHDNFL